LSGLPAEAARQRRLAFVWNAVYGGQPRGGLPAEAARQRF